MTPIEKNTEQFLQRRWTESGFDGLLPFEKNHIGIFWLVGEVMNGGIEQFLWNSSGDLAKYAKASLEEIRAERTLALLEEAMALIPGGYCEDVEERRRRLKKLSNVSEAFDSVSRQLQRYPEQVEKMSLELLRLNYLEIGLLHA